MTIDPVRLAELAWAQLWQVTLVALLVAILVKAIGHRRPHLAYLLWLLVIAKCLTPPIISSPTGVFSWARMETRGQSEIVSPDILRTEEPNTSSPLVVSAIEETETADSPSDDRQVLPSAGPEPPIAIPEDQHAAARFEAPILSEMVDSAPAQASFSIPWSLAIVLIWALGAATCATIMLTKYLVCAWAIWRSSEPADEALDAVVARLSEQLGIRRGVRLMITNGSLGPAVYGIFRPTILLPKALASPDFAKRVEPILAHELIHFRRGDTFLGVLQLAAQIIWWFHPLVWWANHEATRERERCCDEEAVAGLRYEPAAYAQTLLDVLRSKRKLEPVFAQPGVRPVDITARRLEHIMQSERSFHRRTPAWHWLFAAIAGAMLLPGGALVFQAGATASSGDGSSAAQGESVRRESAQDEWAQYGGSSYRNNTSDDTGLPEKWNVNTGENVKWTASLGNAVYSSPIVADGKVFIGTNNYAALSKRYPKNVDLSVLVCFDAETGEFLWQHTNEKLATGRVHDWPTLGICSTSCVEGKRLWYVNNRNELVCLDTDGFRDNENDGPTRDEADTEHDAADVIWKLDIMDELGASQHNQAISSVTIAGDLIFAGTSHGLGADHLTQANDAPSFIAVNKNTGKVVWRDSSPSDNILHGQWSSPAYGVIGGVEQVVFCGGDGWIYGFDVSAIRRGDTKQLWRFDGNPKESKWILGGRGTRNNAIAIPVIHGDRVYVTMGQDPEHGEGVGHVWCIDATKRGDISPELVFSPANPSTPIPHKREQAADPDKGDIVTSNPNSGVVWHFEKTDLNNNGEIDYEEQMHRSFSSVVIRDGLAIVPDLSGIVHCLDADSGKPYWNHDLFAAAWATPYVADGKIFMGDEDGKVTVFALSKVLDVIAVNELETPQYTTIMSVKGTMFVPSVGKLIAIQDSRASRPEKRAPRDPREATRASGRSNPGLDWPSSRGNPANTGVAAAELPDKLEVHWKMNFENELYATPVVVDGVTYIADLKNSIYSIDMETGKVRWRYRSDDGFQASPFVLDGKLYAGDLNGNMHCLDAATGKRLWKIKCNSVFYSAPNGVEDLVIFVSGDGVIYGVRPKTGKIVWKTNAGTEMHSTPAIANQRVIVAGCDELLYVFDLKTGQQLSTTDIESPTGATPAVRNGLAYVGTTNGVLFCVDITDGRVRWRYDGRELGEINRSAAAVTDDLVILAGHGRRVIAVDVKSGNRAWQFNAKGRFRSSPVIVGDHVLIGSKDGRFYVLDGKTGESKLVHETGGTLVGSVAVAGGKLLLTTAEGVVHCFADPKPAKQADTANVNEFTWPAKQLDNNAFRIESIGDGPRRSESSIKDGVVQLTVNGRSRFLFGTGQQAIAAEADRAVIRGDISKSNWESLDLLLEGNVQLVVNKSKLQVEKIRYSSAKRQFELDGVGTLQLPAAKVTQLGSESTGIRGAQSAQEIFGIGIASQPLRTNPKAAPVPVQVKFSGPERMVISLAVADDAEGNRSLVVPARINLESLKTYRLKLSQIPESPGLELFPTLELGPINESARSYVDHNAISIRFSAEDFAQALAGNLVTKVIYLPDPKYQELALAGVETLVSTRLDPGVDPIAEADRRGTILAVLRLGNVVRQRRP